jgi:hypothetical protein
LLDERNMNYTFPINKTEVLLSSGFSLLWQCFELSPESKLAKDNQKSLKALTNLLMGESLSIAAEFERVARALVPIEPLSPSLSQSPLPMVPNFVTDLSSMPAPVSKPKLARRQLQAIASRFSSLTKPHHSRAENAPRRATVQICGPPYPSPHPRTSSQLSLSSTRSLPVFSINSSPTPRMFMDFSASTMNLDYLPLGGDPSPTYPNPPRIEVVTSPDIDWAQNLEGMDISDTKIYDGLYNGFCQDQITQSRLDLDLSSLSNPQDWLDQEWPVRAVDPSAKGPTPQSVLSASGDSITSAGEEFSGCGSNNGSTSSAQADRSDIGSKIFRGITMPVVNEDAM